MAEDGTFDKAKGNLKQAGGDLTDDKSLKNEGRVDEAAGNVKEKTGQAADKAKEVIRGD
jgi:uncharacterized protein YjbJ (UPF0337 family)